MSTVGLQSDISTRWISANGTLVNLIFGAIFWILLRWPTREKPIGTIRRSPVWIASGAIGSLFFILVLGRGITWSR
jgi:hypothetical protein